MSGEAQILSEALSAEELQAKSVAEEATVKARQKEAEAAAEAVIERFVSKIKDRKHKESLFTDMEKEEIKNIVHTALSEFFKSYGLRGKNVIVTAAVVIGAVVVIFGGFKSVLTWLGFAYIR